VACDVVAFAMRADDLRVLLIQRKDAPFKGLWALPGGFVNENESLERAAARELHEETAMSGVRLEQLGAFGDPGRDPRGHTVSVVYMTFLLTEGNIAAGDDASAAGWHAFRSLALDGLPPTASMPPPPKRGGRGRGLRPRGPVQLAFDHARILGKAYRRLLRHLDDPVRDPAAFDLVPPRFTLAELKHAYEVIVGRALTPSVFRKLVIDRDLVVRATAKPTKKAAEQLYRWNRPR
jgi:8-oxo-dGTP diphosphatase